MDTVYQILITFASQGGTAALIAVAALGLFGTAHIACKIYTEVKKDAEIKKAKAEFNEAVISGDANRVKLAIQRLRDVSR